MDGSFYEHQKAIITNVIDNPSRFEKEIYKSRLWLTDSEQDKLCEWLEANYPEQYKQLLQNLQFKHQTNKAYMISA
ncbi:hypothetical protein KDU71_17430 [Carboxylicivirga sediminis]|uniref:Uncharacterized protein n=1 Tax=Carboxylicivirga sediminis TaxID=2006564 RepID=A0A941F7R4_9BACT|nr:hypothetical protein [Carboxylicivirga sediminis]MBR8537353.1 hypothetical protein [Carboxylicivirga sediminis]